VKDALLALAVLAALALAPSSVDARQVACVGQPSCYQAANDHWAVACVQPTADSAWLCVDFVCECMPVQADVDAFAQPVVATLP